MVLCWGLCLFCLELNEDFCLGTLVVVFALFGVGFGFFGVLVWCGFVALSKKTAPLWKLF